jgi:hypothetical protein
MLKPLQQSLKYSKVLRGLLAATAGFIAYGGWAYYINASHGDSAALKALFTQGIYSFTLTLITAFIMEWLFQLSSKPATRFCLTFFITSLILYSTSWGINVWAGTPEILLTILPGAILGTFYTLSYTLTLFKLTKV